MQPAATASAAERHSLGELFAELCRIESPSGRERVCAERVAAELRALGLHVDEDDAGTRVGSDCGNLLVRIAAHGGSAAEPDPVERERSIEDSPMTPSLLLCAHLDTAPLHAAVEPMLVEGGWENTHEGVLGADNKAAVAVLLALARRVSREGSPVDLELLFTVGEERALAGARAFAASTLRSDFGYVFDHASPIGELVLAAPCNFRLDACFHGAAAHAGVRPEYGSSAILAAARAVSDMPLGRVDEQTTANVGTIHGGGAVNVVPERCTLNAEVRGLDETLAEKTIAEMLDCVHEAANLPECDCDVDVTVQRMFSSYSIPATAPAVSAAETALRSRGYEPRRIDGGASDANALIAQGVTIVNLANGTERSHQPDERVSVDALEGMLDVALALPGAVAAQSSLAAR